MKAKRNIFDELMEGVNSMQAQRESTRAEILAAVDKAEAPLAHGEGRAITTRQSMRELAGEVKQRGRTRLPPKEKTR